MARRSPETPRRIPGRWFDRRPVHGSGLGCDPLELSCRGFRVECEVVGAFLRLNTATTSHSTMVVDRPKPQRTEVPARARHARDRDFGPAKCGEYWLVDEPRRVTLREVAELAAVSPSAASAALRGDGRLHTETRERILAAAEELGYRRNAVARSLRRSSNGVVVTVMYDMPSENSLRRPQVILGAGIVQLFRSWQTLAQGMCSYLRLNLSCSATLPADVVVIFNMPQGTPDQTISVPDGAPTIRVVSATDLVGSKEEATMRGSVASVIWDYHAALGAVLTHLMDSAPKTPGMLLPPETIDAN